MNHFRKEFGNQLSVEDGSTQYVEFAGKDDTAGFLSQSISKEILYMFLKLAVTLTSIGIAP